MALVRYYKFNLDLFDSVGGFDLRTHYGAYPSYVSGILGYGAQAATSGAYGSIWGCTANGAAANAVICANATEATNGVSEWSLSFWVKVDSTGYYQQILYLDSGLGTTPISIVYDTKYGAIGINGSFSAISGGTWYFICLRKTTGGSIYYSINAGSETTISGTAGANYFNSLTIGANSLYAVNYFTIDDLRIFNNLISTGDRNAIYNSGSPAEASTTTPTAWQSPTHQHKLNGGLTDSIGSVTASGTGVGYLGSGLFSASSNAVRLSTSGASLSASNSTFAGASKSTGSFSFFTWYLAGDTYLAYPAPNWSIGPITHESNPKSPQTTFASTTVSDANGFTSSCCLYVYNDIFQRLAIYGFDSYYNVGGTNLVVLAEIAAARPAVDITGWTFDNGISAGASALSDIDEVRFYPVALTGGDYISLYNGGTGTEAAAVNGSASGALATVMMSGPSGSGAGTASRSAGLATITMSGPAGAAGGGATGSASLATITVSALAGSGTGDASGSPAFSTVAVQTFSGGASGGGGSSVNANGLLATMTMSAATGGASGTATGAAIGSLATITTSGPAGSVYAFVTPTYGWKFQSALPLGNANAGDFLDSVYGERLDNQSQSVGTVSYPLGQGLSLGANPWSAANLGNALTMQATNNQQKLTWPGGAQISNSAAPISFCFWIRDTSNITGGIQTKSFDIYIYNFRLYISRSGSANTFQSALLYFYNQLATSGSYNFCGAGNASTASNVDFIAVAFTPQTPPTSPIISVWYGANGTLTNQSITGQPAVSGWFTLTGKGAVEITNIQAGTITQTTETTIDDLRLFNYAIAGSEVYAIYNGGAGGQFVESASASGGLATITLSGPAGAASGTISATATGALATITVSGLAGSAAQGASGLLPTIALSAPAGTATGTSNASATGALATITMISLTGTAAATAGGTLPAIVMTAPDGIATFSPAGILPFVLMTTATGSATGGATRSGALGTASLSAPAGSGTGGATCTGGLSTVTLSSVSGSATAGTNAGGLLGTMPISSAIGSATGSAPASGALATITVSTATGSATGSALPSSALSTVTLSGLGGAAIGSAPASGSLATLPISAPAGAADGSAINASALGTITLSGPAGAAIGMAPAISTLPSVVITAPAGSVTGNASSSGAMASVSLTPSGGAASGSSPAAGNMGTITLSAPSATGTGVGNASAAAPTIAVMAFSGSAEVSVNPAGNLPTIAIFGASATATGQLIPQAFAPVVILPALGAAIPISAAVGAFPSIAISALGATATGQLVAQAFAPIAASPALGSAVPISSAVGAIPSIAISAPGGASIGSAGGLPAGSQIFILPPLGSATSGTAAGGRASVHTIDLPVLGS